MRTEISSLASGSNNQLSCLQILDLPNQKLPGRGIGNQLLIKMLSSGSYAQLN